MKKNSLIDQIHTLLEYMWNDEKKHYHESECPEGHIFLILKEIRDNFGLTEFYRDYENQD